jgi:succinate dehydrogenase / fumarate reductase cytochrome b subunit
MPSTRVTDPASDPRASLADRLFALSGLVPLGAFLVVHVAVNARAIRGQDAFAAATDAIERVPALRLFEAAFVFAPLAVHGALGLLMIATRRPFGARAPSLLSPSLALTMRATGVIVAAFLAMHLPEMRLFGPGPRLHGAETLTVLSADLSSLSRGVPWRGIAYLIGTGAVTLHFAVGAWTALARTRHGAHPTVRRVGAWAAAAVGSALFLFFVDVVVLHATGARLFGSASPAPTSGAPCPDRASSPR